MKRFSKITVAAFALAIAALMFTTPVLAAKAAPTSKVNLNSASSQQLETLPGVGPALAGRIVEYRQKSGGFKSANELLNVKGIGEKNFAKIQAYVVVDGAASAKADASTKKAAPVKPEAE